MPAPAVIPAPIAYIKVVAVKKLVVGFWRFMDVRWSEGGLVFLISLYFICSVFLGIKIWVVKHSYLQENGNRSAWTFISSSVYCSQASSFGSVHFCS